MLLHLHHNSWTLEQKVEARPVAGDQCLQSVLGFSLDLPRKMAAYQCEAVETDEAGNVTATYVQTVGSNESLGRVDVIQPKDTKALWQKTLDIFLPSGYPHSVTDDYLE